jgi:hypothetical protein
LTVSWWGLRPQLRFHSSALPCKPQQHLAGEDRQHSMCVSSWEVDNS